MSRLALIHTVPSLAASLKPIVEQHLPGWRSFNIADENMLQDTLDHGILSKATVQRLARHVFSASDAGADAIVVTCSTLGEAVDAIAPLSSMPLFRIDRGMAFEAVGRAQTIGVLAC